MLRVYIYIDDVFTFKTEIFGQSVCPILDLRLKFDLPENCQEIRLEMYDASSLSEEEI